MDYAALRAELVQDPLGLGYSGLADQAAADKLNALDTGRTLPRTAVPTAEVLRQIDLAAWPTPGTAAESWLRAVLSTASLDASDPLLRANLGAVFPNSGATQATRGRLLALATRTASRAEELGLGVVLAGDVALARGKSGGW